MEKISNQIVHYGGFKEALDQVVDLMRSEYSSSVIIRGNPGSGKKSLINEAVKLTKVNCVSISPEIYTDDYAALKAIAMQLGFQVRGTKISDLMIEIRRKTNGGQKQVIVLEDFEELCSQRQCLLYNLMNLIHTDPTNVEKGSNVTLIGLTCNLEWAENIEKRVRSRLNAKCINLKLPYSNKGEYIEFASLLIGQQNINKDFEEMLEYMYWFTNRSIRSLKKYLLKVCEIDGRNQIINRYDKDDYLGDYQIIKNNLLRERLKYLTPSQLDILKLASYFCFHNGKNGFTLTEVERDLKLKNKQTLIDFTDSKTLRDTALLAKLRLLKPEKPEQVVGMEALMYPAFTSTQFKAIVEGDEDLHSLRSDDFWRSIR